jgi:DNA mismatch repair protein MutL
MSDIIQLLPDAVANQIAAGEVIQRPASVIKELVENAVDAGATDIQVIIKDAGRTMIQVIDNGGGMSETDARMAFERHATSKIRSAHDLFSIRTMGFRGEALASIAAIAQVELNTRTLKSDLGTRVAISGSRIESQEPVSCPVGTNFIIKNLFYNVPARRRFLKSNATEMRHIINEFQRVALANTSVAFSLIHNEQSIMNLPVTNLRQRISNIMGRQVNAQLIPVETDATILHIHGFIGKPQSARRTSGEQFFFVNNRYMRHPYLHKAVTNAYENLISADTHPAYFLFFEIDPEFIDINIHPTKTEIKFEDDTLVWKVLNASVRESLGKFNIVPSIDFDTEGQIQIPSRMDGDIKYPEVKVNPEYNPFNTNYEFKTQKNALPNNWESLYRDFESGEEEINTSIHSEQETIILPSRSNSDFHQPSPEPPVVDDTPTQGATYFQVKNRYILSPVKSGLMMIDQRRAHQRILFEHFLSSIKTHRSTTQQILFPETLSFNPEDTAILKEMSADLAIFGFDLKDNGDGSFSITGVPSEFENVNTPMLIENLLEAYKTGEVDAENEMREKLAQIMAVNACMNHGETLSNNEMTELVNKLFRCQMPHFSPAGKPIISILDNEELEKRFR